MDVLQDTLIGLAEIAIALAGFSAIVVMLRRGADGRWSALDAARFQGMVLHSCGAFAFALLPTLMNAVIQNAEMTLHIAAGLLGTLTLCHAAFVLWTVHTNWIERVLLAGGFSVGLLQWVVFTDRGFEREHEIYLVGVAWHTLQAAILFLGLVWIPSDSIRDGDS
jgi:hypothetical protein